MSETEAVEIIEKNISYIVLNWFGHERSLYPVDHEAKWFRDELGYDWVKVREDVGDDGIRTRVIRSDLVVDVVYNARALS